MHPSLVLLGLRGDASPAARVQAGTIAGLHTIAECHDLIWAHTQILDAMAKGRKALAGPPDGAWDADFAALVKDWQTAIAEFQVAAEDHRSKTFHALSDDHVPCEDSYLALSHVLSRVEGQVNPGDEQDLANRLHDAGGAIAVDANAIQPKANDADLSFYNASEALTPSGLAKLPGKLVSTTGGKAIVGGLVITTALYLLAQVARGLR